MPPTAVLQAPEEAENGRYIALFEDAETVRALTPDLAGLGRVGPISVCVTAAGAGEVDFVSRYFAPNHGVDEDPVTGSNHSLLAPFWGARLSKTSLNARQVSARGGALTRRLEGERVIIGGQAVTYLRGIITILKTSLGHPVANDQEAAAARLFEDHHHRLSPCGKRSKLLAFGIPHEETS